MNPIDLLGRGVGAATGAARVATSVPKFVLNLLRDRDHDGNGSDPFAAARDIERDDDERVAPPADRVTRPAEPTSAAPTAVTVPRGERRFNDVRGRAPRRRTAGTDETLVESEGAAAPSAQIRVDAPWGGYDTMKAAEIVARVKGADGAAKAVVRLYEQTHKKRKSILDATAS
jgi:hypothetical protein